MKRNERHREMRKAWGLHGRNSYSILKIYKPSDNINIKIGWEKGMSS
jgi:hypothetical protein